MKHNSSGTSERLGFAVALSIDLDVRVVDETLRQKRLEQINESWRRGKIMFVCKQTQYSANVRLLWTWCCARLTGLGGGRLIAVTTP
jgi:ABC-type polysaccharide/polyol phosphate transport system ATPase subunit